MALKATPLLDDTHITGLLQAWADQLPRRTDIDNSVIGGAAMVRHGLREKTRDIDALLSPFWLGKLWLEAPPECADYYPKLHRQYAKARLSMGRAAATYKERAGWDTIDLNVINLCADASNVVPDVLCYDDRVAQEFTGQRGGRMRVHIPDASSLLACKLLMRPRPNNDDPTSYRSQDELDADALANALGLSPDRPEEFVAGLQQVVKRHYRPERRIEVQHYIALKLRDKPGCRLPSIAAQTFTITPAAQLVAELSRLG